MPHPPPPPPPTCTVGLGVKSNQDSSPAPLPRGWLLDHSLLYFHKCFKQNGHYMYKLLLYKQPNRENITSYCCHLEYTCMYIYYTSRFHTGIKYGGGDNRRLCEGKVS